MKRLMMAVVVLVVVWAGSVCLTQEAQIPQMPATAQAALEQMVGTWNVQSDPTGGAALVGRTTTKWTPGKQYLMVSSQYKMGDVSTYDNAMIGWDGLSENGMILFRMAAGGIHEIYRMKAVSETVSEGAVTAVADGSEFKAKVRMVSEGPDKATWYFTEQTRDGQSEPDWKVVFTRVRKD